MKMIDILLAEMDQEANSTARVLERVPQAQLSWRPHARSFSLGQLALHVATIPGNVAELASHDSIPAPPQFIQAEAATAAELVPALTASLAKAREVLGGMDDAKLMGTWRLMSGTTELMAMPRAAVIRMIMLNHWYHHRGQLLVYLRMHNVPLPSVYGPTADENPFAQAAAPVGA
jgi:uncharacterized damage-inducible protein DinB